MTINLNLELTDHCNIKCKMCSQSMRDEAHGVPMRFMSWETWRQSLKNLRGFEDEVALCPHWLGEPTIHPQFDQFIEYAFAENFNNRLFREFKLHTNAIVFNVERIKLLIRLANLPNMAADTFRFIHFSIDAFSAESYQEVKGSDKRELVYRNVENFLRIRESIGMQLPKAAIAFVVQDDNSHEAVAFRDYWTGILKELNLEFDISSDWPNKIMDIDVEVQMPMFFGQGWRCALFYLTKRNHRHRCRRCRCP